MNFIKTFFLSVILLMALILGFIYSIDPYDKYGINVFGFETKAVAMARENKFNMLEYSKKNYEAFVIGSSSAHRLNTSDVENFTNLKTFNYAVQHTTPEDYLAITRHIFSKFKPKLILLQMDFYGLNENFKTDTRFYTSPLKKYLDNDHIIQESSSFDSDYLTLSAIVDSFKVIWVNFTGTVRHLYLEDGNYHKEKPVTGEIKITQFSYNNYKFSQNRIALLKEIQKICHDNKTRLIVWSAPYSLAHIQKIESSKIYKKSLEEFKFHLKNTFDEVYDFTNLGVAPYDNLKYFRDSSHPTKELFAKMIEYLFSEKITENEFGARLR
jgi:hypothetical protein